MKAVEAHVAFQMLPKLFLPSLVVLHFEAPNSMADEPFETCAVMGVERALVEGLGEPVALSDVRNWAKSRPSYLAEPRPK